MGSKEMLWQLEGASRVNDTRQKGELLEQEWRSIRGRSADGESRKKFTHNNGREGTAQTTGTWRNLIASTFSVKWRQRSRVPWMCMWMMTGTFIFWWECLTYGMKRRTILIEDSIKRCITQNVLYVIIHLCSGLPFPTPCNSSPILSQNAKETNKNHFGSYVDTKIQQ